MPKELEQKLKKQAKKKGFGKKRTAAYVYGTLRKTGWIPSTQKGRGITITKGENLMAKKKPKGKKK